MTKEPIPPPQRSNIPVVIRGDHPHRDRAGWIPMTNGEAETINLFGRGMVRVEFHDGTGCFAELHNLGSLQPPPPRKQK